MMRKDTFIARVRLLLCSNRANRGETLTEALVSIAIGGLAVALMATAIVSSVNMTANARDRMDDYFELNNVLVQAENASPQASGTVAVKVKKESGDSGDSVSLDGSNNSINVGFYESQDADAMPIVSYREATP